MLSAFWQSFGGGLGERGVVSVFTPAFAFWAFGFVAWSLADGPPDRWLSDLGELSSTEQAVLAAGIVILVVGSGAIVKTLGEPALRLLEGYWPRFLMPVDRGLRKRVRDDLVAAKRKADEYSLFRESRALTNDEQRRSVELTSWLRRFPADREDAMPTRLGNLLRSAESRPFDRYGLDVIVCWPRLWLLLPADVKDEIPAARRGLDSAAELVVWSLLAVAWVAFAWWAPLVALLCVGFSYWLTLRAASTYGDLLEAAFDLYRFSLFEALRRPLPDDPSAQLSAGKELSQYLLRGPKLRVDGAVAHSAGVAAVPAGVRQGPLT